MKYFLFGTILLIAISVFTIWFAGRYGLTDEEQCRTRVYGMTSNVQRNIYRIQCEGQ